jgi:hypothetical protein
MIRLVILAVMGTLAPILIAGAFASTIVLMTAPLALIYVLAFVALTPISGLVLWRVLSSFRHVEPVGGFIHRRLSSATALNASVTHRAPPAPP